MDAMPERLEEKQITSHSGRSVDSGISSIGSNSNDSTTDSGDESVKAKDKSANRIFLLPFSPLKERTITEVAVPMYPNYESSIHFTPPVRVFRQHHHFECGEKMTELLSRLPDYDQSQSDIVRSIYVVNYQMTTKRQHHQISTKTTNT